MTWSITVTNNRKAKAAIASIADDAWVDIDYTSSGDAQVGVRGKMEPDPAIAVSHGH